MEILKIFWENFRDFLEAWKRIFLLRELQLSKKFRAARAYSPASTHNDISVTLTTHNDEKSCLLFFGPEGEIFLGSVFPRPKGGKFLGSKNVQHFEKQKNNTDPRSTNGSVER